MPHTLPELASDLRYACVRLVRRVRYDTQTLSPSFFSALAYLSDGKPATAAELAAWERVSAPSMSRTVGELADRGLINREPDPDDRRRVSLTITDEGREALTRARRERDQWMVARLEGLTPQERATLSEATTILRRMLEEG